MLQHYELVWGPNGPAVRSSNNPVILIKLLIKYYILLILGYSTKNLKLHSRPRRYIVSRTKSVSINIVTTYGLILHMYLIIRAGSKYPFTPLIIFTLSTIDSLMNDLFITIMNVDLSIRNRKT